jgi:KUP system potassium uptake protein
VGSVGFADVADEQPNAPQPDPAPTDPAPTDPAHTPAAHDQPHDQPHAHPHAHAGTAALALGALGIVYGDIGTSPLYAFREAIEHHHLEVVDPIVLGACSLAFWALIIIISVKYLALVMRADNRGEGGILALLSLVAPPKGRSTRRIATLVLLGVFGTALLYGDGMITPAISVLSAVEGFEVASPALKDWVIPVSVVILVVLFLVQRKGTGGIGRVFGPVMLVWFGVLALLGVVNIVNEPSVLAAVNPIHAVRFFGEGGFDAFLALGSIFLVVTGGEALYADMGHFGRRPIAFGWFSLVLPALVLNYFGQGAKLLQDPTAITSPLFEMAPAWSVWPLAVLATVATVIASQALISGAFSLTSQAVQLDYLPRLAITHTSASQAGQIYVPIVNWVLMGACIALVLAFRTSSNLAAAYGIAVTATMFVTTLLFAQVARSRWGWSSLRTGVVVMPLLAIDLAFFGANIAKIPHGGWFPLVVAAVIVLLMTTWKRGRQLVAERLKRGEVPIASFIEDLPNRRFAQAPGTAIFLFKDPFAVPPALMSNLRHNRVLHELNILLSVRTADVPRIERLRDRVQVTDLGSGFMQIILTYGFMEEPDVLRDLSQLNERGPNLEPEDVTYFLGRETIVSTGLPGMSKFRERLFAAMDRSASSATRFFKLPNDRVFELRSHVEI